MKKVLLAATAIFTFGLATAQEDNAGFSKGDLYLSGSASFSSTKVGDFKTDGYSIAPAVGYFVTENIALEAGIGFNKQTMGMDFGDESFDADVKGFVFSAGGKYFFTPADKFSLFAGLGFAYASQEVSVFEESVDLNTFAVAFHLDLIISSTKTLLPKLLSVY
jgi:long-subunit fatty acid transport protein